MNPLFIYINNTGDIKVEEIEDARSLEYDPLWNHISSIEPKEYLRYLLNKNPKIVDDLRIS